MASPRNNTRNLGTHHQVGGFQSSSSSSSTLESINNSGDRNDSLTNLISTSKNQIKNNNNNNNSNKNRTITNYQTVESVVDSTSKTFHNPLPMGIRLLNSISPCTLSESTKRKLHKSLVLLVTFIAYAAFHMGRRPLAVVKAELHHVDSNETSNTNASLDYNLTQNWAPFDGTEEHANKLFGYLDTAFLSSYAIGMFFSGILAERMDLRLLLTLGCALSGLGLIAAGLARQFEIHSLAYFIGVQIISGGLQSTGWPVVVTCVGNWLAKSERGLIYGLWNSHTNLGNVLGAVIAGAFVKQDWGLSFIVPGIIMLVVALIQWLFLVPHPSDVLNRTIFDDKNSNSQPEALENGKDIQKSYVNGKNVNSIANFKSSISIDSASSSDTDCDHHTKSRQLKTSTSSTCLNDNNSNNHQAVSFWRALCIPGVIEYSLCLFFSKLVSYTFLYWLPKYLAATRSLDSQESAFQSIWFDIGGIVGAIIAGLCSDVLSTDGLICGTMLLGAIPAMFSFQSISASKSTWLIDASLQALVGALVNGPYCLITTSVSVDLGDRIKDGHAMATVAAIIDGMGSLGAVVGPLIAGFISRSDDWWPVFMMLIVSNAMATVCLTRIIFREIRRTCC